MPLTKTGLSGRNLETLCKKFRTAYFIAKEKMSFKKMTSISQLEEIHGVDLGEKYKTDKRCVDFVRHCAIQLRGKLREALATAYFFSVQCDSSTDAGNAEKELFATLYLDTTCDDGKVHVRSTFFTVRQLTSATGEGLYKSLREAMSYMNIDDWKRKLVGIGCDGASANIAGGGLRGLLQNDLPWSMTF